MTDDMMWLGVAVNVLVIFLYAKYLLKKAKTK